jgi:hypothetical protein
MKPHPDKWFDGPIAARRLKIFGQSSGAARAYTMLISCTAHHGGNDRK